MNCQKFEQIELNSPIIDDLKNDQSDDLPGDEDFCDDTDEDDEIDESDVMSIDEEVQAILCKEKISLDDLSDGDYMEDD